VDFEVVVADFEVVVEDSEVGDFEVEVLAVEVVMVGQVGDPLEEQGLPEQYRDLQEDLILIEGIDHAVDIIDPGGGTTDLGTTVGGIIHIGQGIIIDLGIILRHIWAVVLY
jgi:hypothetical protein